jgi:vacuolar protein sorting-associated protein 54
VPPVKPAILPRVKRKDFDTYLRAVAPEWEKYQRNKLEGKEGVAQLHPHENRPSRAGKEIPPLDSVPAVFFDSPFDLSKPATFAKVIEQQEGQELADPSALSHSLPLLEKMSHYADTIELHLIREISQRSSSFFEALSNLQELQTESEQCLDRIARLRSMLQEVDEKGAKRGLQLVRLNKRLRNLQEVQEGLKVVESAEETVSLTRGLVSGGDWGEALNFIDGLHDAWGPSFVEGPSTHSPSVIPPPRTSSLPVQLDTVAESEEQDENTVQADPSLPPIHLSTLKAFVSLPAQLQALSLQISSALTNDLVMTFRSGIHSGLSEKVSSQSGIDGMNHQDNSSLDMRVKLTPLLQGLIRTKNLKNGLVALRGVALEECRNAMKQVSADCALGSA